MAFLGMLAALCMALAIVVAAIWAYVQVERWWKAKFPSRRAAGAAGGAATSLVVDGRKSENGDSSYDPAQQIMSDGITMDSSSSHPTGPVGAC